jgi:SAM-dependent methyltransferase
VSLSKKVRYSLFQLVEKIRKFVHYQIMGLTRRLSTQKSDAELNEYYKLYDEIYKISDTPDFVKMYKNRDIIYRDFLRLRTDKYIPTSGSLLDLGCGEGGNTIYFQCQGYSATGIDASETAIKLADKNATDKHSDAVFRVVDILNMDPDGHEYDVCVDVGCLHMLVYTAHRKKYLELVRKILSLKGVFYLFQSASKKDIAVKDEKDYVARNITFQHKKMLDDGKVVQHSGCAGMSVSLAQYSEELRNAGFEVKQAKLVRTPIGLFASLLATHGV